MMTMCGYRKLILTSVVLQMTSGIRWDAFAQKTLYEWSHNTSTTSTSNSENIVIDNRVCHAKHVYIVFRHGARNPGDASIRAIGNLHTKLLNSKSMSNFKGLDAWTNRYDISQSASIVPKGSEEEMGLGYRYGSLFRHLLSYAQLEFASSDYKRTQHSSGDFYDGLMKSVPGIRPFKNIVNDSLVRFYHGCKRYETVVTNNATNFQQFRDFSSTTDFQNVANSISQRLGLNTTLSSAELYTMYDFCTYDAYIYNDTTWCSLMTNAEREVMEYGSDIQNYYGSMYGNPLNAEVGCLLLSDILQGMQTALDAWNGTGVTTPSTGYVVGKFLFGHVDTVGKLLASLGLYKDSQPLLASNMATMGNRKFRSSDVIPYSANVAFILYRCESASGMVPKFYVKVLVNEKAVGLPFCEGKVECPYEKMKQAFAAEMKDCTKQKVCGLQAGSIIG